MKNTTLTKIIISTLLIITVLFSAQLISSARAYSSAKDCIKVRDYTSAVSYLEALDGYKDSEVLEEYCEIMKNYEKEDFKSIYHCYRALLSIEEKLDNRDLREEFTKTTTELETLYNYYDVFLYAN